MFLPSSKQHQVPKSFPERLLFSFPGPQKMSSMLKTRRTALARRGYLPFSPMSGKRWQHFGFWIQWQSRGCGTFCGPERILDTDNVPASQTHAYLKTLMNSGGDHGMQAFLPWPGFMPHRAWLKLLRISSLGSRISSLQELNTDALEKTCCSQYLVWCWRLVGAQLVKTME